jgi:hypothetical protein
MTSGPLDTSEIAFDPGSMPSTSLSIAKAVWYRRPWFLATVGVVFVVGASVLMDLPHHVTKPEDAAAQNAIVKQINSDTATCVFAIKESYRFYHDSLAHTLAASNVRTVKNYLLEDQTACSFASGSVFDLTQNISPLDTAAGKQVDAAYQATEKWVTYDAVGAIVAIRQYFGGATASTTTASLRRFESYLSVDRDAVYGDIARASSLLDTTLTAINLPSVDQLRNA